MQLINDCIIYSKKLPNWRHTNQRFASWLLRYLRIMSEFYKGGLRFGNSFRPIPMPGCRSFLSQQSHFVQKWSACFMGTLLQQLINYCDFLTSLNLDTWEVVTLSKTRNLQFWHQAFICSRVEKLLFIICVRPNSSSKHKQNKWINI